MNMNRDEQACAAVQSTYEQAVDYIESIPGFAKKNPLEHTGELLSRLGNPQNRYQVVHVAGTNGKGSVCAYLYTALRSSGRKCGFFTSPHLVTIRERFSVDGEMITEEDFAAVFDRVMQAVREMGAEGLPHPAYFELLLAMGFLYFAEQNIEILVMETGLGGLRDATNVVRRPAACVITSISFDHTEYLGSTLEEIAAQKAGIIKEGVPVIFDAGCREAAEVILQTAETLHAPAVPVYPGMAEVKEWGDKSIAFVLNNKYYDYVPVTVPFAAQYQVMNASLAMTALRSAHLADELSDRQIAEAVEKTRWPGRMEMIAPGVIVDGAHNKDGIEAFAKTARRISREKPVSLLFAAVVEKDYEGMIRHICEEVPFSQIVVTQVEGYRRVDAEEFARIFAKYTQAPITSEPDVNRALRRALQLRPENGVLFCAGSLYLVGEIEAVMRSGSPAADGPAM